MAEFGIVDLSQVEPYELPEGNYIIHHVGADDGHYVDRRNSVQIDFTSHIVIVWQSEDRLKKRRLRSYPRERVLFVDKAIA